MKRNLEVMSATMIEALIRVLCVTDGSGARVKRPCASRMRTARTVPAMSLGFLRFGLWYRAYGDGCTGLNRSYDDVVRGASRSYDDDVGVASLGRSLVVLMTPVDSLPGW